MSAFVKLEEVKKQLAAAVLAAETQGDGSKISRAATRLYYAIMSRDNYKFRSYPSIEKKRAALNYLSSDIDLIKTALEKGE